MNSNFKLSGLALLAAITCAISSCKKSGDDTPAAVCRIVRVDEVDGAMTEAYNIVYDAEGRVVIVNTQNFVKTFTYKGNTIITPEVFSFGLVDSIILNPQGLISQLYRTFPTLPTIYGERYTYNADGTVVSIAEVDSTNPHTIYQSSGGNITFKKDVFGGQDETYQYDTRYGWMDGDVMKWEQMKLYGSALFFKTKHLWRGTLIAPITYTFDSLGRVATATPFPTPFLADKYTFTYECK